MSRHRRALAAAVLACAVLPASAAHADEPQDGSGTEIGGDVSSTLALALDQTGATVRATVTTTEPDSLLSVATQDARGGLSVATAGPYAPLDPAFGRTLVAWTDVLAGRATTLRLKSASPAAATVLITLSAATP